MNEKKILKELEKNLKEAQKEYDKAQKEFSRSNPFTNMTEAGAKWAVAGSELSKAQRLYIEYSNSLEEDECDSKYIINASNDSNIGFVINGSHTFNKDLKIDINNRKTRVNLGIINGGKIGNIGSVGNIEISNVTNTNTNSSKKIVSRTVTNNNNCNNGKCTREKIITITYSDGTTKTIKK